MDVFCGTCKIEKTSYINILEENIRLISRYGRVRALINRHEEGDVIFKTHEISTIKRFLLMFMYVGRTSMKLLICVLFGIDISKLCNFSFT